MSRIAWQLASLALTEGEKEKPIETVPLHKAPSEIGRYGHSEEADSFHSDKKGSLVAAARAEATEKAAQYQALLTLHGLTEIAVKVRRAHGGFQIYLCRED